MGNIFIPDGSFLSVNVIPNPTVNESSDPIDMNGFGVGLGSSGSSSDNDTRGLIVKDS